MPFPSRLLNSSEEVVVELHPAWIVLVKPAAWVAVAGGGAVALGGVWTGTPLWLMWMLGAVAALAAVWLALRWLQRSATVFVVTTQRVILRGGIAVKKGWDIRLDRVNDVSFEQSFLERILGYGDLSVDTGGEAGMKGMARMPHPEAVRQLIFEQAEIHRRNTAAGSAPTGYAPVAGAGLSVAEQLEKLDGLRSRGVISDAEFDAEKERLLGT